jgi:type II restriction enzyme
MLTGNIGEWSQIYSLFRLLADGKIALASENLETFPSRDLVFNKVIRRPAGSDVARTYTINSDSIEIAGVKQTIPRTHLADAADHLLSKMTLMKGSFGSEEAEQTMTRLGLEKLKSQTGVKEKILLCFMNPFSGREETYGFNVKSLLAGPSSLFNANKSSTMFRYKLIGDSAVISGLEGIVGEPKNLVAQLFSNGIRIKFLGMVDKHFEYNLKMVDSAMPNIVAEILLGYFAGENPEVEQLVEYLSQIDPLTVGERRAQDFYEHKVKLLLQSMASGLTAKSNWLGLGVKDIGYIVVQTDGNLVCLHQLSGFALMNYLFGSTKLETPSTPRNQFGFVFAEKQDDSECYYLDLNLQVRFSDQ